MCFYYFGFVKIIEKIGFRMVIKFVYENVCFILEWFSWWIEGYVFYEKIREND